MYLSECGWRTPHFGPQQNFSLVHRKTKQGEDLGRRTVIATDQQRFDSGTE